MGRHHRLRLSYVKQWCTYSLCVLLNVYRQICTPQIRSIQMLLAAVFGLHAA